MTTRGHNSTHPNKNTTHPNKNKPKPEPKIKSVRDKINTCQVYLKEVQKQKNPSSAEISGLNNKIKELEKLQTAKKNDPNIKCSRPRSLIKLGDKSSKPSTNQSTNQSKSKLSPGAIAGIVIGSIVGLILIIYFISFLIQLKKK